MTNMAPLRKPANPNFSSGPCTKRPGWTPLALQGALVGRSHRSPEGHAILLRAIEQTKAMLELPDGYLCAIVPGSDTGAFELAMWTMLGPRGVDVLAWESFGRGWAGDILNGLRLKDVRVLDADYGVLPDLSRVDFDRDVVFTWNGTTSGVRVPDGAWIPAGRKGLTFCDATSAAFAQNIDWLKIDVGTFSWQKVLGGEAAHGMLILSPAAQERIVSYDPPWPVPKLFRVKMNGRLLKGLFEGETINTPSMLAVADYLDALEWARSVGGLQGLCARADANAKVIYDWLARSDWAAPLAKDVRTRSNTSICLRFAAPEISRLGIDDQAKLARSMARSLDEAGAARDIAFYRDAPPGLRIWTGATVETSDLAALAPWMDWAYNEQERRSRTSRRLNVS